VAKQLTRRGLEALSREMEVRLSLDLGPASASFAMGTTTIVEGELVDSADSDETDVSDDAAAVNPESGDAPETATASSADADRATSRISDADAGQIGEDPMESLAAEAATAPSASADDPTAHPVEPLAEVAASDSPLPPGLDDKPAPVANLDADLPPGTI
jgi:hypothetical protein